MGAFFSVLVFLNKKPFLNSSKNPRMAFIGE
jgi:hypothetical protein